jgi:hypothetical protein
LDLLSIHRTASLTSLSSVATGRALAEETRSINELRSQHDRQVGKSSIVRTHLDHLGSYKARVTICLDVRRVRGVGPGGHSIVPVGRNPFLLTDLTLVSRELAGTATWFVSSASDREATSCDA